MTHDKIEIIGKKVVTANEMQRIEAKAFSEGINEESLMLEAGKKVAVVTSHYITENKLQKKITLLVGKGNNGADAYVAGTILLQKGFSVKAIHLFDFEECSHLNKLHCDKFRKEGGEVDFITSQDQLLLKKGGVIIDGLIGTGFAGKVSGIMLMLINIANTSGIPIIAIDIPSGLDGTTGMVGSVAIKATNTVFLSLPKTGFFLEEGWNYVGTLTYADIGLPKKYVDQAAMTFVWPDDKNFKSILPCIKRNRHKYEAGYVIAIAGSFGMTGAAKLSSIAALRSGSGMVKVLVPEEIDNEMVDLPYEILKETWNKNDSDKVKSICDRAKAILIGPGLGRGDAVTDLLESIFLSIETKPMVIDADGLFFLSNHKKIIPQNSVLTPHRREMLKLLGMEEVKPSEEKDFIDKCCSFAKEYNVTLVLKGAPTYVFHATQKAQIFTHGDPGMATAGTGDVLTGVIAALLAQEMCPYEAALLGVYIHGIAGEIAAREKTSYSMIASDIINNIPSSFKKILASDNI
jgi:ADP-dependent NAD(P)H-hydrate dehydratase / NAD(P)H-hydrate epimerase